MRIIRNRPTGQCEILPPEARSVVAIGNFDGVHRGHQALLSLCHELAAGTDPVAVVTFEPLPAAFFRPDAGPARLSTVSQKLGLLEQAGLDATWMMRFDENLSAMSAEDFIDQVLVQGLRARHVVVGEDFRFGQARRGDVGMLAELGQNRSDGLDFTVHPVSDVTLGGERISSSRIRRLLNEAAFDKAAELLGRPFRMEGHVTRGEGLGKDLGYPTANLKIRALPSPVHGVLVAWARVRGNNDAGEWLPAVCNLGNRPAVGGTEPLLEVHLIDFEQDLYGQHLEVQFVAKLRDELDFDGIDALVEQMKQDECQARTILETTELPGK